MTNTELKAKALEANFDKNDRGYDMFAAYVEFSHNWFGWATQEVKDRAIEMVQARAYA
jgi:hypothetical protein